MATLDKNSEFSVTKNNLPAVIPQNKYVLELTSKFNKVLMKHIDEGIVLLNKETVTELMAIKQTYRVKERVLAELMNARCSTTEINEILEGRQKFKDIGGGFFKIPSANDVRLLHEMFSNEWDNNEMFIFIDGMNGNYISRKIKTFIEVAKSINASSYEQVSDYLNENDNLTNLLGCDEDCVHSY